MKNRWLIALSILAVISIGAGFYLKTDPEWMHKTYYDYYNQGVSNYLENQAEKAINEFTHIANNSQDPWLKSLALTQVGTIIGRQAFDERYTAESRYQITQYAIVILEEAVVNNPDNGEAKYNLELLKNKLPELSQQMAEEGGDGDESNPDPDPGYSHGGGERGY